MPSACGRSGCPTACGHAVRFSDNLKVLRQYSCDVRFWQGECTVRAVVSLPRPVYPRSALMVTRSCTQKQFLLRPHKDTNNAFTEAGRTREQQEIFSYVRELLRIRREHEALRGGQLWHLAADESSYVFLRASTEERLVVAFNNADQTRDLNIPLQGTPVEDAESISLLCGGAKGALAAGELRLSVPAESISIFSVN